MDAGGPVIKALAELFRGIHYVIGFSGPTEDTNDYVFVLAWLGTIALLMVFVGIFFYYSVALLNPKP
jgi:hypothetical protein